MALFVAIAVATMAAVGAIGLMVWGPEDGTALDLAAAEGEGEADGPLAGQGALGDASDAVDDATGLDPSATGSLGPGSPPNPPLPGAQSESGGSSSQAQQGASTTAGSSSSSSTAAPASSSSSSGIPLPTTGLPLPTSSASSSSASSSVSSSVSSSASSSASSSTSSPTLPLPTLPCLPLLC